MPVEKCSKADCPAPDGLCVLNGGPHQQCDSFKRNSSTEEKADKGNKTEVDVPWTGTVWEPDDLGFISQRSSPLTIGLIGSAGAGKTTYLAMLYTLLFNGKGFANWRFSGSYTLRGWELQARTLQIEDGGVVAFPLTTSSAPDFYSIYHLALKKGGQLRDVLLADSSGEVFSKWATDVNDPGAENARWIYEKADAFMFFIDCEKLIKDRARAKRKIMKMARQLQANLKNRSVMVVWSKADKMKDVLPNLKEEIEIGINSLFPRATVLPISNYSKSDNDEFCQINNLKASEHLLELATQSNSATLKVSPSDIPTDDYFFLYKGSYGSK